jgi:hypothetical protein
LAGLKNKITGRKQYPEGSRIVAEYSSKDRKYRKGWERTEYYNFPKIQLNTKKLRPEANLRFLLF